MIAQGQNDVWHVELASLSDPDLSPSTVGKPQAMRAGLRPRHSATVLDQEHALQAACQDFKLFQVECRRGTEKRH